MVHEDARLEICLLHRRSFARLFFFVCCASLTLRGMWAK